MAQQLVDHHLVGRVHILADVPVVYPQAINADRVLLTLVRTCNEAVEGN